MQELSGKCLRSKQRFDALMVSCFFFKIFFFSFFKIRMKSLFKNANSQFNLLLSPGFCYCRLFFSRRDDVPVADEAGNVKGQNVFFLKRETIPSQHCQPVCFSCLYVLLFYSWHLLVSPDVLWFSRLCLVHVKKKERKKNGECSLQK